MNISRNKLTKSQTRRLVELKKEKPQERNGIFSDSSTKIPLRAIILKLKSMIQHKIASVVYMVTKMKGVIT